MSKIRHLFLLEEIYTFLEEIHPGTLVATLVQTGESTHMEHSRGALGGDAHDHDYVTHNRRRDEPSTVGMGGGPCGMKGWKGFTKVMGLEFSLEG